MGFKSFYFCDVVCLSHGFSSQDAPSATVTSLTVTSVTLDANAPNYRNTFAERSKVQSCSAVQLGTAVRLWYLPPYSPDLNPIEQAFAKIKHWMRMAQKRTARDTWRHIGDLVATFQATECSNYFANAGYASVKM
jgi:transposase